MKTCVNVLLLIIICCLKSPGQQSTNIDAPHPKKFISQIEIFVGPSLVYPYGSKSIESERVLKIGYALGFGLSHTIGNKIDINIKVLMERKGHKAEEQAFQDVNGMKHQIKNDLNSNYFTCVIMPKFRFKKKFNIGMGGYLSLLQKSTLTQTIYLNDQISLIDTSDQSEIREKLDYGLSLNIGYFILLDEKKTLNIQLLENLGLRNTYVDYPGLLPEKNNILSLLIGLNFQ